MKRSRVKLSQGIIVLFTHICAYGEMIVELKNSPLPCKSYDALLAENKLVKGENLEYANDVGTFLREIEDLYLSLANLQSEINLLMKDRLGDQRGGGEWEPIKILLEELGLCPNRNSKSHIRTPIAKTT
jgi:hypothetical protein